MIYPKKVDFNDTIGVTATSGGLEESKDLHKLENAIKNLKELGFDIVETPNVRISDKLVSSSKEERAKEFLNLWQDEKVTYIMLARGGEFLMEMLPYLDTKALSSATPKWVQGFSDSSVLLFYLTTNFNIATIHAANFSTYGMRMLHPSLLKSLEFVQHPENELLQESYDLYEKDHISWQDGMELEPYHVTEKVEYQNLYGAPKEEFEGRLIGGCMDALKVLIGTEFDKTKEFCSKFPEGMVWYLENCEMPVTELYRALWQMKMAGWFENANAFLIGRTASKESVGGFTYEDALHSVFDDMQVKVIYDVDFGHVAPQWTMVNGAYVKFIYEEGRGKLSSQLK